jgi:hypothetical protein
MGIGYVPTVLRQQVFYATNGSGRDMECIQHRTWRHQRPRGDLIGDCFNPRIGQ